MGLLITFQQAPLPPTHLHFTISQSFQSSFVPPLMAFFSFSPSPRSTSCKNFPWKGFCFLLKVPDAIPSLGTNSTQCPPPHVFLKVDVLVLLVHVTDLLPFFAFFPPPLDCFPSRTVLTLPVAPLDPLCRPPASFQRSPLSIDNFLPHGAHLFFSFPIPSGAFLAMFSPFSPFASLCILL